MTKTTAARQEEIQDETRGLSSDGTYARYRAVEPSSGSNVIPRRACPGLAGPGPHMRAPSTRPVTRARAIQSLLAPITLLSY